MFSDILFMSTCSKHLLPAISKILLSPKTSLHTSSIVMLGVMSHITNAIAGVPRTVFKGRP